MRARVLDLFFPARCLGCGGSNSPFCQGCIRLIAILDGPGCSRCGRPFEASVHWCRDCPPHAVSWSRSVFLYEGPARRALMRLKFGAHRALAEQLAGFMAMTLEATPPRHDHHPEFGTLPGSASRPVVTWVPLAKRRRRKRGFDQAEVLARAVASIMGFDVARLLERNLETSPQARRSGTERRRALVGAFAAVGEAPPVVLLIDDVLTTGATAGACAKVLRQAGAKEVGLLTAARSLGGPVPARCYNPRGLRLGSVVARETSSR